MNPLKLFLNISTNFNPGQESIGSYLIRQGIRLIQLGDEMNRTDNSNLEQTIKDDQGLWETEGEY